MTASFARECPGQRAITPLLSVVLCATTLPCQSPHLKNRNNSNTCLLGFLGKLTEITHVKQLESRKTCSLLLLFHHHLTTWSCRSESWISESRKVMLTRAERRAELPLINDGTGPDRPSEGRTAPHPLRKLCAHRAAPISPADQGWLLLFRRARHGGLHHPVTHLIAPRVCPACGTTNYIGSLLIRQARKLNLNGYGVAK